MNQALKTILTKYYQETWAPWMDLLPKAVLKIRTSPEATKYTSFELLFGRPPSLIKVLQGVLCQLENISLQDQLIHLGEAFSQINKHIAERLPVPTDQYPQPRWHGLNLSLKKGPYVIILTTPTAIKVTEIHPWIHHSRIKRAHPDSCWKADPDKSASLETTLKRQYIESSAIITLEADKSTQTEDWVDIVHWNTRGPGVLLLF